jgi:hypothetical protein
MAAAYAPRSRLTCSSSRNENKTLVGAPITGNNASVQGLAWPTRGKAAVQQIADCAGL